jgi:hypothetical protein
MSKPRFLQPGITVEVTDKTMADMFLFRPSPEFNDILVGILGVALARFSVLLHAIVVMSNHYHLLLTAADGGALASFMNLFKSKLAKEAGRLHRWPHKVFGRRYSSIPVLDEEAMVGRMEYIATHGPKEGLVWDATHWPGVTSIAALQSGEKLCGTYYDRAAYSKARHRAQKGRKKGKPAKQVKLSDFAERVEVELSPLPCWAHLSTAEQQQRFSELLERSRAQMKEKFREEGITPLGARAIRRQHPHDRPRQPKRGPAPLCHASSHRLRVRYREAYREFVAVYRRASERFRAGELDVVFPPHSFPPPRAFVLPAAMEAS